MQAEGTGLWLDSYTDDREVFTKLKGENDLEIVTNTGEGNNCLEKAHQEISKLCSEV